MAQRLLDDIDLECGRQNMCEIKCMLLPQEPPKTDSLWEYSFLTGNISDFEKSFTFKDKRKVCVSKDRL
jgi:hypothetical protein